MTRTFVRLGSTYRITVPFYALSDGTTLTDLDAVPSLQMYDSTGITAIGSPVTCTKLSTGKYYGDIQYVSPTFSAGDHIWKMAGLSGGKAVNQTGKITIVHTV